MKSMRYSTIKDENGGGWRAEENQNRGTNASQKNDILVFPEKADNETMHSGMRS